MTEPDGSIAGLQRAYAAGLSPIEVIEECLGRIDAQNGTLRALIFVDHDGARAAAREADDRQRSGRALGPLHGVPIAVKDMIDVASWPTTAGSRLFEGRVAQADATCVARLRQAGAILIGKANLHELTVGGHANPWYGKVVNPLDRSRGTGGTSSGSAAAVAAGFCVAALGTDTGGSNRSPAATTGLVGFKPSHGLVDPMGTIATARSLDAVGPIARTVEDARLLTAVMAGGALADEGSRPAVCDLVLATCPDLVAAEVDPTVRQGIESWLEDRRRAGATVTEISFGDNGAFVDAGLAILMYEFAEAHGAAIRRHPASVGDAVLDFLDQAERVTADRYALAQTCRRAAQEQFRAKLADVDAVVVPTCPCLAPRLEDERGRVGEAYVPFGLAGGRFRRWANMLGMPAVAVPVATSLALPASIQLAAGPGRDGRLLQIAASLTGW